MKLTDKCKQDFEKWFIDNYVSNHCNGMGAIDIKTFDKIPKSMQYGVLVDFFDSVGIYNDAYHIENAFRYMIDVKDDTYMSKDYKTRPEAREQAIIKANEIYNNSNNK